MEEVKNPQVTTTPTPLKRNRQLFLKSGMREGAMLKFLTKKPKMEVEEVIDLDSDDHSRPKIPQSSVQTSSTQQDSDTDDDCMIVEEVSREKKIQVIDLSWDEESVQPCSTTENTKSKNLNGEADPVHTPAPDVKPENIKLAAFLQTSTSHPLDNGSHIQLNARPQNVEPLRKDAEISTNLKEEGGRRLALIPRGLQIRNLLNLQQSADLTLKGNVTRPHLSEAPQEIVDISDDDEIIDPPVRTSLSLRSNKSIEFTVSIESDDEVILIDNEVNESSVPFAEAIDANANAELGEDDAFSMYDIARARAEIPEETARKNESSRPQLERKKKPAALSEMLASETLNEVTELTRQLPHVCETSPMSMAPNANESGRKEPRIQNPPDITQDIEIKASGRSVHLEKNPGASSNDNNEPDSNLSAKKSNEPDHLLPLCELEKNLAHSTPLKTTMNNNLRLAPLKRLEKVQYSIIRQQTPDVTQKSTTAEEENSENLPATPPLVILNSYSVRQLEFSTENANIQRVPMQTPSLVSSGVQNESNDHIQNKIINTNTPAPDAPQRKTQCRKDFNAMKPSAKASQVNKKGSIDVLKARMQKISLGKGKNLNAMKTCYRTSQVNKKGGQAVLKVRMQKKYLGKGKNLNAMKTSYRTAQVNKKGSIDVLMKKKSFGKAAGLILKEFVDTKQLPKEDHVADLTCYTLNCSRVAKDVQLAVINIWEQIFSDIPINTATIRNYYSNVLSKIEIPAEEKCVLRRDVPDGYSDFLVLVIQAARNQCVHNNKDAPINKFLEICTSIFDQEYKEFYLAQDVKRIRPLILELLCSDYMRNYKLHIQFLLKELFSVYGWEDRFYSVLSWTSRLRDHFSAFSVSNSTLMIAKMCHYFKQEQYLNWDGIIRNMDRQFGKRVCIQLLTDIIYSSNRFATQELSQECKDKDRETLKEFLTGISSLIKAGFEHEKVFSCAPVITTEKCNLFGERKLHLKVKKHDHQGLEDELCRIRRERNADVNEKDHNENTALHDAAAATCFKCILKFYRHNLLVYENPNIPDHFAANLLAKNKQEDTPLHLLAKNNSDTCVALFGYMAKNKGILPYCGLMRNLKKEKPWDLARDSTVLDTLEISQMYVLFSRCGLDVASKTAVLSNPMTLDLLKLWYEFTLTP